MGVPISLGNLIRNADDQRLPPKLFDNRALTRRLLYFSHRTTSRKQPVRRHAGSVSQSKHAFEGRFGNALTVFIDHAAG